MTRARVSGVAGKINRAGFIVGAAAVGLLAATGGVRVAAAEPDGRGGRRGLTHRGVSYDTGTYFGPGPLTREVWNGPLMRGEVRAVREQLHCTSVQVFGTDIERLVETSTTALRHDLHVWVQPRLFDHPQEEVLDHLARTARVAERLRRWRPAVSLNVGCEAPLFTPGIIPGADWQERMRNAGDPSLDWVAVGQRLNTFLAQAASVARAHFTGKITYAAATWEDVDWRPFDLVGLDYYSFHPDRADHVTELNTFRRWRKPITICEFGTSTFVGAPETEGGGWSIVDYTKPIPEIIGNPVRSEQVQADHITTMLEVFESQRIHSAHVYTFIAPDVPHSPNPRYDLDMASFGVVKVIRDNHNDPASPYRWQPKRAFHAIARHYRQAEHG